MSAGDEGDGGEVTRFTVTGKGDPSKLFGKGKGEPDDDLPMDAAAELEHIIGTEASTYPHLRLYRVKEGKPAHLKTIPSSGFTVDDIPRVWGGGTFNVQLLDARKKIRKQWTMDFDGAPRDPDAPATPAAAAVSAGALPGETELGATARMLREVLTELRNPPRGAERADPVEMAVAMMGAIQQATAPLMEAVLAQKGGGDDDRFLRLFSLGLKLGQRRDNPDVLNRLLDEVVPAMKGLADREPAPAQLPPGAPAPDASVPRWAQIVAPAVPRLSSLARANRDPGVYATVVLDELTQEHQDLILAELRRPRGEFLADWFALFPETGAFREWFAEFADALAEELGANESPEAAPPPPPAPRSEHKTPERAPADGPVRVAPRE